MDWKMALAWYMFHVKHEESITYAESHYQMSCMPPEFKEAVQAIHRELEELAEANGHLTKPDGSEY
jgi:hypothetical protein